MFHTLWLNLLFLLTLFPGIIMFLINRFPFRHRINDMDKYVMSLIIVILLNIYDKLNDFLIIISIAAFSILIFIIEYIFTEWGKLNFNKFKYVVSQVKKPVFVMIVFPCCEEMIYRYFLYLDVVFMYDNVYLYFILSVIAFVFVHFFSQKMKCFYKIPFAIIECLLFIAFKNIFVCILVHMNFNILIYAYNTSKYSRGRIM